MLLVKCHLFVETRNIYYNMTSHTYQQLSKCSLFWFNSYHDIVESDISVKCQTTVQQPQLVHLQSGQTFRLFALSSGLLSIQCSLKCDNYCKISNTLWWSYWIYCMWRHSDAMIHRLEHSGLGYHIEAHQTADKLGQSLLMYLFSVCSNSKVKQLGWTSFISE